MSEGAWMKATPPQESLGPASTPPPPHPSRARRGRGKRKRWPRCSSGEHGDFARAALRILPGEGTSPL